jgi:hypothetical protein
MANRFAILSESSENSLPRGKVQGVGKGKNTNNHSQTKTQTTSTASVSAALQAAKLKSKHTNHGVRIIKAGEVNDLLSFQQQELAAKQNSEMEMKQRLDSEQQHKLKLEEEKCYFYSECKNMRDDDDTPYCDSCWNSKHSPKPCSTFQCPRPCSLTFHIPGIFHGQCFVCRQNKAARKKKKQSVSS